MTYKLHYSPDSANIVIHMILEELGTPFELELVDRSIKAHKQAEFLSLNPQGLIPVLEDEGHAIFETAAIALHLADKHASLMPSKIGSMERAYIYQWLFFLSNTFHADLRLLFGSGDDTKNASSVMENRSHLQNKILQHIDLIEQELSARQAAPWFSGSDPGILDFYLGALCRWLCLYPTNASIDDEVWLNRPKIMALLDALENRDAVKRAFTAEKIEPPYFRHPTPPHLPRSMVTG